MRRSFGYRAGAATGAVAVLVLAWPANERFQAHGPMNTGHEALRCAYCHAEAPGTYRQQLQAGLRYLAGLRRTAPDFGRQDVDSQACLTCHERPDDRHPVYRFLEPRFAEAREALRPDSCLSCHLEHRGQRVTLADIGYCTHCHEDTRLRKDPLDVPHDQLVAADRWETCLGCHDFHGNHVMTTARRLRQAIRPERIHDYFAGAPSPFGNERRHQARKEPGDG